jgi:AraC-like DNA-binding protein
VPKTQPNPSANLPAWRPAGEGPANEELVVKPKVVPIPVWGVVVYESRHAPGFVGQLRDDFSKFLLVIAGRARWAGSSRVFNLHTNSLIHIPAGVPHTQEDLPNDPVTLYAIHYRDEILPSPITRALSEAGILHWNLDGSARPLARPFRSDFQEMLFEQATRREGWELVLRSCLGQMAVRALRMHLRRTSQSEPLFEKGRDSAQRVATYISKLESRFYRQQTLDEAARATGLSRRQFTELFRKITGTTWHKHVEFLRLEHAQKLLLESETTTLAVAFECGFENPSNFHRAFKRALGCSPSAFREDRQGARNPAAGKAGR